MVPDLSFNPSSCDSPGYCVFKTLQMRPGDVDPAVCQPGHEDAFELVRLGFQSVPETLKADKPAVFVHPKLKWRNQGYDHLTKFRTTGNAAVNEQNMTNLLRLNIKTVPREEALTAVQALLVYIATLVFNPNISEQPDSYRYMNTLSEWTQTLFPSTEDEMPRGPSPWQEWLFAESIRRTILMSYALTMSMSSFKYGYCANWLFLESLPFDCRAGLWMAESPQAWIAAAQVRTGEEVGEKLQSFHEYSESLVGVKDNFHGDVFLKLIVNSHNGVN